MAYYLFELREAGEPTTESRKYEYTFAQLSYCEDDIRRLKAQYNQWEGMLDARRTKLAVLRVYPVAQLTAVFRC